VQTLARLGYHPSTKRARFRTTGGQTSSSASLGLADYSQVEMLGARYESVNFRAGKGTCPDQELSPKVREGKHPAEREEDPEHCEREREQCVC
jgi:hypothetical protein